MLPEGTRIRVTGRGVVTVGPCLGEGGQGWVHSARSATGHSYALKWYKVAPPDQAAVLTDLVGRGAPSDRFLWPLGLACREDGGSGFGYLMALRPADYVGLASLLHGRDELGRPVDLDFLGTINLCHQLARSFLRLHALGLCYRDINYGNVFFRRGSGDVLICDNDNVGVDGTRGGVLGAPGFMAPEVVLRLAGPDAQGAALPSARTDLHSLAVTLFLVLFLAHPLEGTKTATGVVDVNWQVEHYGRDPVFVFDDRDDRNRPLRDHARMYWEAYPGFVRELFTQAFTVGLHDADARVMEGQWAKAMLQLRDLLTACISCEGTIFHDPADPGRPCVRCGASQPPPRWLHIGTRQIVLGPRTRIHSDHLGRGQDDISLVGEIARHPSDPRRWGLRNQTGSTWQALDEDGKVLAVPSGRTIETLPGMRIDFGGCEGVVVDA